MSMWNAKISLKHLVSQAAQNVFSWQCNHLVSEHKICGGTNISLFKETEKGKMI